MPTSTSKSTTTTSTEQKDQRVVAETGSSVIGPEARVTIHNEFSETVADAFNSLIDFASDIGSAAVGQAEQVQQSLSDELQRKTTGEFSGILRFFPYVALGLIGFGFLIIFGKKK